MTLYAADEDGATVCLECVHGMCVGRGPCEAPECQCDCNHDDEADRARELDDREPDKLEVIAAELEREMWPKTDAERRRLLHTLTKERFGRPPARRPA